MGMNCEGAGWILLGDELVLKLIYGDGCISQQSN